MTGIPHPVSITQKFPYRAFPTLFRPPDAGLPSKNSCCFSTASGILAINLTSHLDSYGPRLSVFVPEHHLELAIFFAPGRIKYISHIINPHLNYIFAETAAFAHSPLCSCVFNSAVGVTVCVCVCVKRSITRMFAQN